jgi:hypothetical protein
MHGRSYKIADVETFVFDVQPTVPIQVDPSLAEGWLCFERGGQRRRLSPIPDDWDVLPDAELARLWELAQPVPRLRS